MRTITNGIYEDDVVMYIANRHNINSQELVRAFLADDAAVTSCLEDNEKEILRGMRNLYKH